MSLEDSIRNNLGVGEIERTPDALIMRPAPVDMEGEGFEWGGSVPRFTGITKQLMPSLNGCEVGCNPTAPTTKS